MEFVFLLFDLFKSHAQSAFLQLIEDSRYDTWWLSSRIAIVTQNNDSLAAELWTQKWKFRLINLRRIIRMGFRMNILNDTSEMLP